MKKLIRVITLVLVMSMLFSTSSYAWFYSTEITMDNSDIGVVIDNKGAYTADADGDMVLNGSGFSDIDRFTAVDDTGAYEFQNWVNALGEDRGDGDYNDGNPNQVMLPDAEPSEARNDAVQAAQEAASADAAEPAADAAEPAADAAEPAADAAEPTGDTAADGTAAAPQIGELPDDDEDAVKSAYGYTYYAKWKAYAPDVSYSADSAGKILSTTSNMQYSTSMDEGAEWTDCTDGSTTVSQAGVYYVRVKAEYFNEAGYASEVNVEKVDDYVYIPVYVPDPIYTAPAAKPVGTVNGLVSLVETGEADGVEAEGVVMFYPEKTASSKDAVYLVNTVSGLDIIYTTANGAISHGDMVIILATALESLGFKLGETDLDTVNMYGLMTNISADGQFHIDETMTKAQLVVVVSRLMDLLGVDTGSEPLFTEFADVNVGDWCYDALLKTLTIK